MDSKIINFIDELVRDALTSQGVAQKEAMLDLSRAVKMVETLDWENCNPFKSIEESLPKLALLLVSKDDEVQGCAISIFRRVQISAATREVLAQLKNINEEPLILEAIQLSNRSSS